LGLKHSSSLLAGDASKWITELTELFFSSIAQISVSGNGKKIPETRLPRPCQVQRRTEMCRRRRRRRTPVASFLFSQFFI
jgi:hypothetical protein